MRHYQGQTQARLKSDRSPVTDADEEAERLILKRLAEAYPGIPVVAEEEAAAGHIVQAAPRFFLVDPLDGTKEFLSRNGEFTVNIAEVVNGNPVAGAVYAPAVARMFYGDGGAAFELTLAPDDTVDLPRPVRSGPGRRLPTGWWRWSRSHGDAATDAFLKSFAIKKFAAAGSSLKFCLVAAGEADIYARGGRTMEWDTAAGHAVLAAAGGSVKGWDGKPFLYGKPDLKKSGLCREGRSIGSVDFGPVDAFANFLMLSLSKHANCRSELVMNHAVAHRTCFHPSRQASG